MDDLEREKRREYARQYRERNRELLRLKARDYWEQTRERRPPKPRPTLVERFWTKVTAGEPAQCWEWQGALSHGYGSIAKGGQGAGSIAAHRLSWEIHNGPIPEGMDVLHTCDNPPCVNPAHLYIGTDVENARDRVDRGRAKGGYAGRVPRKPGWNRKVRDDDRRGYANRKFTAEQEREIACQFAAGGVSKRSLAKEYGVSHPTITAIIDRAKVTR